MPSRERPSCSRSAVYGGFVRGDLELAIAWAHRGRPRRGARDRHVGARGTGARERVVLPGRERRSGRVGGANGRLGSRARFQRHGSPTRCTCARSRTRASGTRSAARRLPVRPARSPRSVARRPHMRRPRTPSASPSKAVIPRKPIASSAAAPRSARAAGTAGSRRSRSPKCTPWRRVVARRRPRSSGSHP